MWDYQTSCPGLFVCTAILCWDYQSSNYFFFNITRCTPSPLDFRANVRLLPQNFFSPSPMRKPQGFICSNCTGENFVSYYSSTLTQCQQQQPTMIELRDYCPYFSRFRPSKNRCECTVANRSIQPITNWARALVKPGKSDSNTRQVNQISGSASTFVYVLAGFIMILVLLGGVIGMIFYWLQLKPVQMRTVK